MRNVKWDQYISVLVSRDAVAQCINFPGKRIVNCFVVYQLIWRHINLPAQIYNAVKNDYDILGPILWTIIGTDSFFLWNLILKLLRCFLVFNLVNFLNHSSLVYMFCGFMIFAKMSISINLLCTLLENDTKKWKRYSRVYVHECIKIYRILLVFIKRYEWIFYTQLPVLLSIVSFGVAICIYSVVKLHGYCKARLCISHHVLQLFIVF